MRLTKYLHSCLLAEDLGQAVLFDPGNFTAEQGVLDVARLPKIDVLVITHEHPDHFDMSLVEAVCAKYPDLCVISTPAVVAKIREAGLPGSKCASLEPVVAFSTERHASLEPLNPILTENVAVHVFDRLTVTGDRHDVAESKSVLAYPIIAPWGTLNGGAQMVLDCQPAPKFILPLHDYHWRDDLRRQAYDRLEAFFQPQGITVLKPETGVPIEV